MTKKMNDGWIEWHGGECPVKGMPVGSVELNFRNGITIIPYVESYFYDDDLWSHQSIPFLVDIIAYRIIAEKETPEAENPIPDRHELQKYGKHPAPCAKFCESNAYESQIRRLNNEASGLAEEINRQALKMADVERQRDELINALAEIQHYSPVGSTCYEIATRAINAIEDDQ